MASAVYVVRQLGHGGLQASDTAGLLAVALAVVAGLVAVVALRKQAQADTAAFADASLARGWAGTLARQVEAGEGAVRRQLLGDDTKRINLTYRLVPPGAGRAAAAPGAGRLFTNGPGGPAVPDIAAYYRETKPERLVITGAAGAGKTVLALELLLALIDGRSEGDPVPVRIPLSRWDTERQSLPDLLVERLVEAYDWPPAMAGGLVRHHLVLPVLDGLDEMDAVGPGGAPDPAAPRAAAVVRALNAYQQGREAGPLVLTCRTGHYDTLTGGGVPGATVLDAARIGIEPVDAADARGYLTGRALDEARWQPLTDHLATEPGGMLATVLSTPWKLGLTATVYHHDGDPAELLALPDPDAVDRHLLARCIPAAVRHTPNPRRYTAQQVHRWLHRLSVHLDPAGTTSGTRAPAGGQGPAEATDLVWHELWPLAGRLRVRTTDAVLTGLAILTTLPLAWAPRKPVTTVVVVFLSALLGSLVGGTVTPESPRRLDTRRLRTSQGLRDLAGGARLGAKVGAGAGVAVGAAGGLVATVEGGTVREAALGTVVGAVIGVVIGLVYGVTDEATRRRAS
ncbi:NACHT domain-containing protein [Streptomyces sp. NPDC004838]